MPSSDIEVRRERRHRHDALPVHRDIRRLLTAVATRDDEIGRLRAALGRIASLPRAIQEPTADDLAWQRGREEASALAACELARERADGV